MTDRMEEVVYLNSCQLFIESVLMRKGNYYLVWKKGKKNVQSNIFQANGEDPVFPKELLSLSLKVYTQAGTPQPRHTHLILFGGSGEEIARTKLMIHQWEVEFEERAVQLGEATLKLRTKRKTVMKLQKFHRLRNEVEETSEDESARFLKKVSMKRGNSEKEEIIRLTKQVQDLNYLVEKLKEQRNGGLSLIQKLETELSHIDGRICRDLSKLGDYYTKKMEMRESVYKEQMQHLVTSFNRNYQTNRQILQGLVTDSLNYEQQIRELKESNQNFITKQSQNFESLISEMQRHKEAVDEELRDSNEKLHERQGTITQLNEEIDRLNEDLQQLRGQYKQLQDQKDQQELKYSNMVNQLTIKTTEQEGTVNEQQMNIDRLVSQNRFKDEEIISYNKMIAEHVKEKNEMNSENLKLIDEREELTTKNQIQQLNNQQLEAEVKDLQGQLSKMQTESEQMARQYHSDLEKMNDGFRKDIEAEREQNLQLIQQRDNLEHEKEMLKIEMSDREALLTQKNGQIQIYLKELEQNKEHANSLAKDLDDSLERFREQNRSMSDQLTEYIHKAGMLESQNTQMHAELREINANTQNELVRIKEEHEALMDSNKQLLEEQIDMLRRAKEEDDQISMALKNDYETQITSIIQQHKQELDQMDRIFKEDLDKKDSEVYKLIQEKNHLEEEFEAYQYKVKMEDAEKELEDITQRGPRKRTIPSIEDIQEIQEDEDEEEDDFIPLKKNQKVSKNKKLLIFDQEEEEEQEEQEEQEQEEQEDIRESVLVMIQKKKSSKQLQKEPVKGKLKVKKSNKRSDQAQEDGLVDSFDISNDLMEEDEMVHPAKVKEKVAPSRFKKNDKKGIDFELLLQQKQQLEERVADYESEIQALIVKQQTLKNKQQRQSKRHLEKIRVLERHLVEKEQQIQELIDKLNEQDTKFADKFKLASQKRKKQVQEQELKRKKTEEEQDLRTQKEEDQKSQERSRISVKSIRSIKAIKNETKSQRIMRQEEPSSPRSVKSKKSRIDRVQETDPRGVSSRTEEKWRIKLESLEQMLVEKQKKIEKIQLSNRQLGKEVMRVKTELSEREGINESKVLDNQKNLGMPKMHMMGESFMRQSITNLQDRVSSQKQKYSEVKMKLALKSRENQEMILEINKLKRSYDELQQRNRKQGVPRSNQQMQSEIDQCNRKILELSRNLNQARLQRDSLDDEVRIVRKKMAELTKSYHQSEGRAAQLERENQDTRRKEQRLKREIEEYQEDLKKVKENNRKTIEELSEVRKSQSEYILDRKKVLDQVVRLEGMVAQKQTDIIKVSKELQRLKAKMNENLEGKQGRQREYRVEMQRLQIERSKGERKSRELEETISMLKQKMDVLEREGRKSIDQRKQGYGEKLKEYIEQIQSISGQMEEYQHENAQLKHQNSQFFEQNQMLKISFEKLQIKYEQVSEHERRVKQEVKRCSQKINELQVCLGEKAAEESKNRVIISALRKQLDSERMVNRRKTQKSQQLQQINQRFLYDIKGLKLRLNQFQSTSTDQQKLTEELFASQQTIGSLSQQLHKISEEYQEHSVRYVYTLEDVQRAIRELKEHEDRVKEEEMTRIIQELDQNSSSNRKNMETELLTLYNQNQKMRVGLHRANQNALQLQLELSQLEHLKEKSLRCEKQKGGLERTVLELTDQLKSNKDQMRRLQIKFNESIRNQENKSTENVVLIQKCSDLNRRYQELNEAHVELKQDDNNLLQKYKAIVVEKDRAIQKTTTETQVLHNKLLALELQVNRLRESESMGSQDHFKLRKKLEGRIEELQESFKVREREAEVHFKTQMREVKTKYKRMEEEVSEGVRRNEELQEGVFMLQGEVQELTGELTSARSQLAEEGELYTIEVNKLRSQMREMEERYDYNLRNLEEELSVMSKELTTLKYARQNVAAANSRMRTSRHSDTTADQRGLRRFQEKMKLKERRIEELKETILAYEETIVQLTRKGSKSEDEEFWKNKLGQNEAEWKAAFDKKIQDFSSLNQLFKGLTQENQMLKVREQEGQLKMQEKQLQISSVKSQLVTVSKLYGDLQKELDKRKHNLNKHIEQDSTVKVELQKVRKEMEFKEEQVDQLTNQLEEMQMALRKRVLEVKTTGERVLALERQRRELMDQDSKKIDDHLFAKIKLKQLETEVGGLKTQNRRLRNECSLVIKQNESLKADLNSKDSSLQGLLKEIQSNDDIISENQTLLNRYVVLNQESLMKFGANLEQLIPIVQELQLALNQKQEEIQRSGEQVEEMRFEFENRFIDYEEIKKANYEFRIKSEERQTSLLMIQQMEERVIVLQKERQDLQFRVDTIRVQLSGVYEAMGDQRERQWQQIRNKVRAIIHNEPI